MSKSLTLALKQLSSAIENLNIAAMDYAQPGTEQDRLRAAKLLLMQTRNAIENGPAYPTTGRAEEFDHLNKQLPAVM